MPASSTGSSSAYGVTAPVRPTLTRMRRTFVCACCAGNLNAVAQRGKLRRRAQPLAQRQVVHLDDDAVGAEIQRLPPIGPFLAERRDAGDVVAAAPVRLDRESPGPHRRQHGRVRTVLRDGLHAVAAGHDLIGERRQAPLGDQGRIQIPHRAGGGVARVREQRLAALLALPVRPIERRARQIHLAADFDPARRVRRAVSTGSRESCARSSSRLRRGRRRRGWRRGPGGRPRTSTQCSDRRSSSRRRRRPARSPRPPALRTRSSNARSSSSL